MNCRPLLARAVLAARSTKQAAIPVRNSSYYKPAASWKPPHLDEMPVPQGSWKAAYNAEQKKNNLHLAVGVAFFVFTVGYINKSGVIFFNAFPPPLPEDE